LLGDDNNKRAYAGVNDCFTHLRALLVLQPPRHFSRCWALFLLRKSLRDLYYVIVL
jgi:hypothetical protein